MAVKGKSTRSDKASIKYTWVPLDVSSFELSDIDHEEDASSSEPHKQSCKKSGPKSPEILSTSQLVSAIGRVWDCAVRPVPDFQCKENAEQNDTFCQTENALRYSNGERSVPTSANLDRRNGKASTSEKVNTNYESNGIAQKMSDFESCKRLGNSSFSWKYLQLGSSYMPVEAWKMNGLGTVGISYDFGDVYENVIRKAYLGLKFPLNMTQIEGKKPGETCVSRTKTTLDDTSAAGSIYCSTNATDCRDPTLNKHVEVAESEDESVSQLYSDYFVRPVKNLRPIGAVSKDPGSVIQTEYLVDLLGMYSSACKESHHSPKDDIMLEHRKRQPNELLPEDVPAAELSAVITSGPKHALPGQRHAFAGALSGTFVSLCLHPVDTIKTVIQSRSMAEKSLCHVVRSIISERGVFGLYRGIASNIASAAPISAVYTYTYESIKGALLPLLPKEYHSVAHCTAGGCASIATSFIFTPSERIKQQMQVGSHYQNCWNALVGILERGGLASLYAGWGAVLCRNIPHSIIKFYTYEALKQRVLSSTKFNTHPSTFLTLICGGVAGSTAALFTTPFDVVKTRLQTQIPGSLNGYDGVFRTLVEISKNEGLKGLYRGLAPRLIMYVSQGAIFFASYEFFKSIFFSELPLLCASTVQNKQNVEDDSTPSTASPSTSSLPKLRSLHS